jgi:hypothetical protein
MDETHVGMHGCLAVKLLHFRTEELIIHFIGFCSLKQVDMVGLVALVHVLHFLLQCHEDQLTSSYIYLDP